MHIILYQNVFSPIISFTCKLLTPQKAYM